MRVPHKAQQILVILVLIPGIMGAELVYDDEVNSAIRVLSDTGSMTTWPLWMAERTDRRESQLSDGARSSRTVGSLGGDLVSLSS